MVRNGSISRRSGQPCWAMFTSFSAGSFFFMLLTSLISADNVGDRVQPVVQVAAVVYPDEGENLTTPATPIRQFVWKVRNWMFHRDDEDVNIEVNSEATSEPTDTQRTEESKSWVRSIAAWFARGIRHLLEQWNPQENSAADGSGSGTANGTEEAQAQDGTKRKDSGSQDSVTRPTNHVFRPWTALPPPPPPGMTANPESGSAGSNTGSTTARTDITPMYTKPSTVSGKTFSNSAGGKFPTPGSKVTVDAASNTSAKKPKRRRPKPISTSTMSATPEMPQLPPITTEEIFIQDTGNEI